MAISGGKHDVQPSQMLFSSQDLTSKMFATRYDLYRRHFSDLHTLQFETVVAIINNVF